MSGAVVSALLLSLLMVTTPAHATVITISSPGPRPYQLFGLTTDAANGFLAVGNSEYNGAQGEVLLYDGSNGSLIRTLFNPNLVPCYGESFGVSVEIAGNLLVVGAGASPFNSIPCPGHVYIFDLYNGSLTRTITSPSPDPRSAFGSPVDIADGLLAVGASHDSVNGLPGGRVYIFDLQTGTQIATLASPNHDVEQGVLGGGFGSAIDILDGHVIVGAPGEDLVTGRAYVFDAFTGALISTFVSPNYPNTVFFGSSVTISDHFVFVGSRGDYVNGSFSDTGVYVFRITGSLVEHLADPDPNPKNSQFIGLFGFSLALSGQNLIVGAPFDLVGNTTSGRVYIFNEQSLSLKKVLVSPDTGVQGSTGCFGNHVESADGNLYISAPCQPVNGQLWAGAVYIFGGMLPSGPSDQSNDHS